MAQRSDIKLYMALVVLAALGGALYVQQKKAKKERAEHTLSSVQKDLPKIEFSEDDMSKITKIVIDKPASDAEGEDDAEPAVTHVLAKEGEKWKLVEPVSALANQKNVESLLKNFTKLEVKEQVTDSKDSYQNYELTEEQALHIRALAGDEVSFEMWAGKSGGRGQMVRLPGQEGVYTVDGFSSFMAKRDTKGWRDLSIVEIATDSVNKITIEQEDGTFVFEKNEDEEDEAWSGKFKKGKSAYGAPIKDFEPSKIEDLLRAYKTLNATGFGDDKTLEETGLEEPVATITIEGEDETTLHFGSNSEGSSRWAKLEGKEQIYSVSSWAADWAVSGKEKFQKSEEKEGGGAAPPSPRGGPPGMKMPHGMPPPRR